jgi:hypothetical protein
MSSQEKLQLDIMVLRQRVTEKEKCKRARRGRGRGRERERYETKDIAYYCKLIIKFFKNYKFPCFYT